jgi:hypothetical protein
VVRAPTTDHQPPHLADLVVAVAKVQEASARGHNPASLGPVFLVDQPDNVVPIVAALDPPWVLELGDGVVVAVVLAQQLDDGFDIACAYFADGH